MQNKKKIYLLLLIVIAVALTAEILFAHPHHHMIWNVIPGADIIIGFLGAWILIFLAKKIISALFQREQDYYDDRGGEHHAG